ncbi:hypothetical protein NFI96_022747, partial [Prochilodus magdalenae]
SRVDASSQHDSMPAERQEKTFASDSKSRRPVQPPRKDVRPSPTKTYHVPQHPKPGSLLMAIYRKCKALSLADKQSNMVIPPRPPPSTRRTLPDRLCSEPVKGQTDTGWKSQHQLVSPKASNLAAPVPKRKQTVYKYPPVDPSQLSLESRVDASPQRDSMPAERQEKTSASDSKSRRPVQPPRKDVRPSPTKIYHVPQHPKPGSLLMAIYRKCKALSLADKQSHMVIPPRPCPSTCRTLPDRLRSEPVKGQTDTGWRKSQHQLVSPKARNLARSKQTVYIYPPVDPSQLSLGERVVQKVQMTKGRPSEPDHIMPHLYFPTLMITGSTQYGRLKVDWVARPCKGNEVELPPVLCKSIFPHQKPQGGGVG